MTESVACSMCGKVHPIDDIELVFELPDVIHALSESERDTRCDISADVCALDRERFFLRGLLPIPVSGRTTPYNIGVWAEISLDTYRRIYARWSDPDQRDEPRLPGALANNLPLQTEDTLGLGVSIQLVGPKSRPKFYVDIHSHPLNREQTRGIDRHRAVEYSSCARHES